MYRPQGILALAAAAHLTTAFPWTLAPRFANDTNSQIALGGTGSASGDTALPTSFITLPPLSLDAGGVPLSGALPLTLSGNSTLGAATTSSSGCGGVETVTVSVTTTQIQTVTAPSTDQENLTAAKSTRTSTITMASVQTATVTLPILGTPPASGSASKSTDSTGSTAPSATSVNAEIGDSYTMYNGDGSVEAGWPGKDEWTPFDDMWATNKDTIATSCAGQDDWGNPADPSSEEIKQIHDAILAIAKEEDVPPQFVLATIMQESKGCVRVPITNYGVDNPKLMQDYKRNFTCNTGRLDNGVLKAPGKVQDPCPEETIRGMIREGTKGAFKEANSLIYALAVAIEGSVDKSGNNRASAEKTDASRFYRAARVYNSGSIDPSGDLGKGIATRCYASDIANRLTGWVKAETKCTQDDK